MKARRTSNSNLFAIDHDAINATLMDANAQLLDRCHELLAALTRVPEQLATDDEIGRAQRFVRQLKEAASEVRGARLSDGRPFKLAADTVKLFFEQVEIPLKEGLEVVLEKLAAAALRKRQDAESLPEHASGQKEDESDTDVLGVALSGDPVVTARIAQTQQPVPGPDISLVWSVERFERAELDLEALRPYFSDHAINGACQKHLAEHGPHSLRGVVYREIVRPD